MKFSDRFLQDYFHTLEDCWHNKYGLFHVQDRREGCGKDGGPFAFCCAGRAPGFSHPIIYCTDKWKKGSPSVNVPNAV
jgi:hypothetical protein